VATTRRVVPSASPPTDVVIASATFATERRPTAADEHTIIERTLDVAPLRVRNEARPEASRIAQVTPNMPVDRARHVLAVTDTAPPECPSRARRRIG
jgi:hypothetical protein